MSYWDDDADFLVELAENLETECRSETEVRRVRDIARDLATCAPDEAFLEELAGKIEHWCMERVLPTDEYKDELIEGLHSIALALKRDPSQ